LALNTWPPGDATAINLYKALLEALNPPENEPRPGYVKDLFVQHRLLLWNFLPMFRGGFDAEGAEGLPAGQLWKER
jgi:hypothetical protein